MYNYSLQLSLRRLKSRHEEFAHVVGSFVQVVTHTITAKTLGYNVEVEAVIAVSSVFSYNRIDLLPVLVDHVGNTKAGIDDLAPAVTVEELGAELRSGKVP